MTTSDSVSVQARHLCINDVFSLEGHLDSVI